MPNILIRGLSAELISRLDDEASSLGLSRNELLRRRLETSSPTRADVIVSMADLHRAAAAASDLLDPEIMDSAWR